MKSLLQDGDECTLENTLQYTVKGNELCLFSGEPYFDLDNFNEDLTRAFSDGNAYNVIRVIRNGEIIWKRTQPINKMMTAIHNGETYPIATHENMKILVDQVSELEAKVI